MINCKKYRIKSLYDNKLEFGSATKELRDYVVLLVEHLVAGTLEEYLIETAGYDWEVFSASKSGIYEFEGVV